MLGPRFLPPGSAVRSGRSHRLRRIRRTFATDGQGTIETGHHTIAASTAHPPDQTSGAWAAGTPPLADVWPSIPLAAATHQIGASPDSGIGPAAHPATNPVDYLMPNPDAQQPRHAAPSSNAEKLPPNPDHPGLAVPPTETRTAQPAARPPAVCDASPSDTPFLPPPQRALAAFCACRDAPRKPNGLIFIRKRQCGCQTFEEGSMSPNLLKQRMRL